MSLHGLLGHLPSGPSEEVPQGCSSASGRRPGGPAARRTALSSRRGAGSSASSQRPLLPSRGPPLREDFADRCVVELRWRLGHGVPCCPLQGLLGTSAFPTWLVTERGLLSDPEGLGQPVHTGTKAQSGRPVALPLAPGLPRAPGEPALGFVALKAVPEAVDGMGSGALRCLGGCF